MSSDTDLRILVIILSVVLAIFLVLSIAAVILVVRVLLAVRRLTAKAEKIADSAENITEFFHDVRGPLTIFRVLRNITKFMQHNKRGK